MSLSLLLQSAPLVDSVAPTLISATVSIQGTELSLIFSENVIAPVSTGFSTTLYGGSVSLTYSRGSGTNTLVYEISRSVYSGEVGTLAYVQPGNGVQDTTGNLLGNISADVIINNSTLVAPAITAPTLIGAALESANSLKIYFSGSAYVGSGGATGLALSLSGGAVTATYASGSGTSAITFTLSRSVTSQEYGTGSYTNPGNGLEASNGDDVANFNFQLANRIEYRPNVRRYYRRRRHLWR